MPMTQGPVTFQEETTMDVAHLATSQKTLWALLAVAAFFVVSLLLTIRDFRAARKEEEQVNARPHDKFDALYEGIEDSNPVSESRWRDPWNGPFMRDLFGTVGIGLVLIFFVVDFIHHVTSAP
jgi:hypothetical protein